MTSLHEQISQLESSIEAQEKLRTTLGDDAVEITIAALQSQLVVLRSQLKPMSLTTQLESLETAHLIRISALEPELEYIFKHALTQDAAYQSLLLADRKILHREVGMTIETLFADRLTEYFGILGEHFHAAGDWDKAAAYLASAGDAAARIFAQIEARRYYATALDLLDRLPESDDVLRRRIHVILGIVNVSLRAEGPNRSLERLAQAEELAIRLNSTEDQDRLEMARIHYWIGHAYVHSGQFANAINHLRQVLPVAEEFDDQELLAIPSAVIGRARGLQGFFSQGEPLMAQAISPLAQASNWHEWILTTAMHAHAKANMGYYAEGIAEAELALDRAEELATLTGIGHSHGTFTLIYMLGRDHSRMLEHINAMIESGSQNNDLLIQYPAYGLRSLMESWLGRHADAQQTMQQARVIHGSLGGNPIFSDYIAAVEAEIALRAGRSQEACLLAEQAISVAQSMGGILAEGVAYRVWGQALAALEPPQWDMAEEHLSVSLQLLEEGDARLEAAWTNMAWGEVCRNRANMLAAREHFQAAAAQFEISGLTRGLKEIKVLIEDLQKSS